MRRAAHPGVAVGFFDGVHLGHRAILDSADVALTFRSHPLSVLAPARAPRLLMDFETRIAAIRAAGVREVVALEFTRELAALPPEEYVRRHILPLAPGSAPVIRCGADWRFGCDGAGSVGLLRQLGLEVTAVPPVLWQGVRISSSRIRACLAAGDLAGAAAMLGAPYRISAPAVPGKGVGRALGFPTLNFAVDAPLRRGVYEVRLGAAVALANYGLAPTMGDRAWTTPTLEVHLVTGAPPEAKGSPAGAERLTIEFRRFLRDERRFASVAELTRAIAADIRQLEGRGDGPGEATDRA